MKNNFHCELVKTKSILLFLGHRFKTTYDFGFVALDILYAYPEDSGTYMCKAKNIAGEAVTTCIVSVDCKYFISNRKLYR